MYWNTSPVNYLICYRLKKAALLLTNTEKKVSAISIETGSVIQIISVKHLRGMGP